MQGYTKATDKEKRKIIADYTIGISMNRLAKKYKRSTATIKKIVDEAKDGKFGDYVKKVEKIKKRNTQDILDTLADDKTIEIITKYKDIITNDEYLLMQVTKTGNLQFFTNTIGMFYDKAIKYQQMQLEVKGGLDQDLVADDGFDNALKKSLLNLDPSSLIAKESK